MNKLPKTWLISDYIRIDKNSIAIIVGIAPDRSSFIVKYEDLNVLQELIPGHPIIENISLTLREGEEEQLELQKKLKDWNVWNNL